MVKSSCQHPSARNNHFFVYFPQKRSTRSKLMLRSKIYNLVRNRETFFNLQNLVNLAQILKFLWKLKVLGFRIHLANRLLHLPSEAGTPAKIPWCIVSAYRTPTASTHQPTFVSNCDCDPATALLFAPKERDVRIAWCIDM